MKVCPLKFDHPSEAQQLNGLGPKLCDRLAKKLKEYCAAHGLPFPVNRHNNQKRSQAEADVDTPDDDDEQPVKKAKKPQLYVPKLRSGAYALIKALSTLDQEGCHALSKNDLIELAQPFCDSSFTAPSDPTKFFTAWNSMRTLENKELVCTKGHPTKRYYLSDEGWEVALRMKATEEGRDVVKGRPTSGADRRRASSDWPAAGVRAQNEGNDRASMAQRRSIPGQASIETSEIIELSSSPGPDPEGGTVKQRSMPLPSEACRARNEIRQLGDMIVLPPGSFDVRLVLDSREIRTTTDRDYISGELKKQGIVPIIKSLPLGDVLWIAQIKTSHADRLRTANPGDEEGNTDIVLEHIMERKRLDDLVGSIKDGRFHEQKFRLHKSGMRNVTYLIEDYSLSAERSEKYGEALESAVTSMQVVNDIFVKQTSKLDDTIRYLARMTETLQERYESQEISVMPSAHLEVDTMLSLLDNFRKRWPTRVCGITFSAFSSLCDKSESMTLRDVYLKMLMCIRGVTGEKAIEIQKIWPTPRALVEAFEAQDGPKAKESMISDRLGGAIPRKKVGKALSTKIAEIWA